MKNVQNNFNALMAKYNVSERDIALRFGIKLRTVRSWKWGERDIPEHLRVLIENELERTKNDEKNISIGM